MPEPEHHYQVTVFQNGKQISQVTGETPFFTTILDSSRWDIRSAWKVLVGKMRFAVAIRGDASADWIINHADYSKALKEIERANGKGKVG